MEVENKMKKWKTVFVVSGVTLALSVICGVAYLSESSHRGEISPQLDKAVFAQKTQKLQMPFIANKGQVDEQVEFYAKTFGGTVFVTKDGEIVYALPKTEKAECRLGEAERTQQAANPQSKPSSNSPNLKSETAACVETQCIASLMHLPNGISPLERGDKGVCNTTPISNNKNETHPRPLLLEGRTGIALREEFVGARVKTIQGEDPSVTKVNYFKGSDPSKWKTNVSTYDAVSLGDVYDGIELKLKAYGNNVEKLFCVKPGADPEQIKISLSGIQPPETPMIEEKQPPESPFIKGDLTESPLEKGARGLWVNEEGQLVAETELGPVKFTKPIAYQEIDGKRVDVEAAYVICDRETSPVKQADTDNGHASRNYGFKVASYDKTKPLIIDPLLASTYLGGSGYDRGNSLALDTSGNVYVTGSTWSTDFPTTSGAYDTSSNGYSDVFVSKLDGGLTSLLASTYLGGSNDDKVISLALDTSGNVYVTGDTYSSNFPTTSGAYDTSFNYFNYNDPGGWDIFVSKLNGELTSLLASTYLGGSDYEGWDEGYSLALDTSGNVYVTGCTGSSDFPTTSGAYDTSFNGNADVFISKLDSGLTGLLASTYLGGFNGSDCSNSLALDASGNVYVTGTTGSTDFPTTNGAYDTSYSGAFVSKLNGELTKLLASTYLGGSDGNNQGYSLALDTSGNVYVTGDTYSSNFPTTSGAYDTSYNGDDYDYGGSDVFVSKLDGNLSAGGGAGSEKGIINGSVVDTGGNAIESVKLTLTGKKGKKEKTTDNTGSFEFTGLDAGTYKITAKKKGYKTTGQVVKLKKGEEKKITITMKAKK